MHYRLRPMSAPHVIIIIIISFSAHSTPLSPHNNISNKEGGLIHTVAPYHTYPCGTTGHTGGRGQKGSSSSPT
ncbi:hypothetical protein HOY82DRAFT_550285, partial [Tuber indicum]